MSGFLWWYHAWAGRPPVFRCAHGDRPASRAPRAPRLLIALGCGPLVFAPPALSRISRFISDSFLLPPRPRRGGPPSLKPPTSQVTIAPSFCSRTIFRWRQARVGFHGDFPFLFCAIFRWGIRRLGLRPSADWSTNTNRRWACRPFFSWPASPVCCGPAAWCLLLREIPARRGIDPRIQAAAWQGQRPRAAASHKHQPRRPETLNGPPVWATSLKCTHGAWDMRPLHICHSGLAYWMPAFLERVRGFPPQRGATVKLSARIVSSRDAFGTLSAAWMGRLLRQRIPGSSPYYVYSAQLPRSLPRRFVWLALLTTTSTGLLYKPPIYGHPRNFCCSYSPGPKSMPAITPNLVIASERREL